mgnify:CR=1 FL=1
MRLLDHEYGTHGSTFHQWVERVGHSLPEVAVRLGGKSPMLQALENHVTVELAAATVGMEALKLAHGDLAALVECAHAAHQVGDLLIVKVMAIAVAWRSFCQPMRWSPASNCAES